MSGRGVARCPRRGALARLLLGVACFVVFGACASVLGIEERREDTETYPTGGYEGCRPSQGCARCIRPSHTEACEIAGAAPASCGGPALGACQSCVCERCRSSLAQCERDPTCRALWACLSETRCELLESSERSCFASDVCGAAIDQAGGLSGAAFDAALELRLCALTSSCDACLSSAAFGALPACSRESGCQGCPDCFQQCICSGDTFSACRASCGDDAPPASCDAADGCLGCERCFDRCTCEGGEFASCSAECESPCSAAQGCRDCGGCAAECRCNGGDEVTCSALCDPSPPSGPCVESERAPADACSGCTSCLARCTCRGEPLERCLETCETRPCDCASDVGGCTNLGLCLCASSADVCGPLSYACDAAPSPCDACPCARCPGEYALCKDTPGCYAIAACLRDRDCRDPSCAQDCAGGEPANGLAFAVAEALFACSQGQGCTCAYAGACEPECEPLLADGVLLEGCCVAETGTCGLAVRPLFPRAAACEPRAQAGELTLSGAACPPRRAPLAPPYLGACLEGCRRPDDSCGSFDDIAGLGCVSPGIFSLLPTPSCGADP